MQVSRTEEALLGTGREEVKCELAAEALRSSGRLRLRVTGGSMLPSVWPGDVLTIDRSSIADIRRGDLVLFSRDHRLWMHRAVEARNGFLITRGDALAQCDAPVSAGEALGRVSSILRGSAAIRPRRTLSIPHSVLAFLLRRSDRLKWVLLRLHALRRRPASSRRAQEPACG